MPRLDEGPHLNLSLDENRSWLKSELGNQAGLVFRELRTGKAGGLRVLVVFVDEIVDKTALSESVIEKLTSARDMALTRTNGIRVMKERLLTTADVREVHTLPDVAQHALFGHAIIMIEGARIALSCDVAQFAGRAVETPESEPVARGPREGFTENIQDNLALVRRRLQSPTLRFEDFTAGRKTKTRVVLAYLDDVASEGVVREARARLARIGDNVDSVLLSEEIAELIEDHPFSLFPVINATERPERIAAGMLEGRVAVFVDGTPFVLFAPTFFVEFFTSTADHTERPVTATFLRWIRIASLAGALFLPSLYVALVSFHQEMLPTLLLLSIASGREGVPFPAVVEALMMELAFEILREAGLRLPRPIGSAISIVGVLVVGQAAVAAGIVSPLMIIIVGATAIASFSIPNFPAANIIRLLRFPILILTGIFGAVGIVVAFVCLSLHLVSLRSLGIPYAFPIAPFDASASKAVFRRHKWAMGERPDVLAPNNRTRQEPGLMPTPDRGD